MNSLKRELKRARPALGTILLLKLDAPIDVHEAAVDEIVSQAFELAEELENRFSKFRESSDVSRFNQASLHREIPVSHEFLELCTLAEEIWRVSSAAFNPFGTGAPPQLLREGAACFASKTREGELDFSGIAKGFIVDKVTEYLMASLPGFSGVTNAGGDLRFFGRDLREADVRLAQGGAARRMIIAQDAMATSSLVPLGECSTTVYPAAARMGLENTVSVVASRCSVADALTKVGWFGSKQAISLCSEVFGAQVLVLDPNGEIFESYGPHET